MYRLFSLILSLFITFTAFSQIHMVKKDGGFLFMEGKDSICFYQKSMKDMAGKYGRCNYIHPLYGSDQTRLTEDFPADHLHHRGVFWAWHQILIDQLAVSDGWELKNFEQKVTDVEFKSQKGIGYLHTTVDWKSPLWKNASEPYLRENTTITMHPKTGKSRRIDFEIRLNALVDGLRIGGSDDEKGYSGFSVRLKLPSDVTFTGDNGPVQPINTAVNAGYAMKMEGAFLKNGKKGSVIIESNPKNPSPANSWIIRKSASMQNAAYPGRQPVSIPKDQPLILKYTLTIP